MMMTEMDIETSVYNVHLTRLIAREDFIKFTRRESTKTHILLCVASQQVFIIVVFVVVYFVNGLSPETFGYTLVCQNSQFNVMSGSEQQNSPVVSNKLQC
jgi:hypothetical protein